MTFPWVEDDISLGGRRHFPGGGGEDNDVSLSVVVVVAAGVVVLGGVCSDARLSGDLLGLGVAHLVHDLEGQKDDNVDERASLMED